MIEEAYVSFETAKRLKEKGFDEPCLMCYTSDEKLGNYGHYKSYKNSDVFSLTAPTVQMAMRWLREIHNLQIQIAPITSKHNDWTFGIDRDFSPLTIDLLCFPTYEEACEAAIKYCLEDLI